MTTLLRSSVASLAPLVAGVVLHAQQPAPAGGSDTTRLEAVVVTASRVPVPVATAPSAVTVLDGEELRRQGVASVADALRLVPGMTVARSGSMGATTTLFLRGGERDYVKVLVDGVPANEPGGDFDFANLTTDNVERIEVVRGPASVLYGSDAVTGVVQIFTRRGAGRTRLDATARGGTFATREGDARVGAGSDRASWSLAAARRETDGILPFNNDARSTVLSAAGGLASARGTALRLTMRRSEGTFHFPTNGAGVPTDSNQYTRERRLVSGAELSHPLSARVTARLALGATELDRTSDDQPDSPGDTTGYYFRSRTRSSRRSADARVDVRLLPGTIFSAGAAYEAERERSDGTSAVGTFPLEPTDFDARRHDRAAYGQLIAQSGDVASITLSARLDDSRFGSFGTGRAAASVRVARGTRLRAAVGNAFKEPAFSETFSTAFTIGRPELRPERSRSWEVGAEQRVAGDRLVLGVTYFDQRFRDMVQYTYIDRTLDQSTPNFDNIGGALARGVELEGRARPAESVTLSATFAWLRTRVTDAGTGAGGTFEEGEPLLRRASRTATLSASWRTARALSLSTTASYTGPRTDRDFTAGATVELPGYTTVDVAGEYALPTGPRAPALALTARVENLLDRRYQPVLGYDAPGRMLLVGARLGLGT